jgi:hypothetical protein
MTGMITGYCVTQVVRAVAQYSLADRLSEHPLAAAKVATCEGLHAPATLRLLRACAARGLVVDNDDGSLSAAALLRTLVKAIRRRSA